MNDFGENSLCVLPAPTEPGLQLPTSPSTAGGFLNHITITDMQEPEAIPGIAGRIRLQENLLKNFWLPLGLTHLKLHESAFF
jgi:hypothetical protein